MPLIKGKSEKAFSHNVGAEINAGKPRAQALAIAYATKRRMARKKMALGGLVPDDLLSEAKDSAMPGHDPGSEMGHKLMSHIPGADRLEKYMPKMAGGGLVPEGLMSTAKKVLSPAKDIGKSLMGHSSELEDMGGMSHVPGSDELEKYMPKMALGGLVPDELLDTVKKYASPGHDPGSEMGRKLMGKLPGGSKIESYLPTMAHGGIVHHIMAKRMAEGGPVDEMGLQDQEHDHDNFLSEFMPPQEYESGITGEEDDESEDPKAKRKGMISGIMAGLHSRHYGK